MKSAVRLVVIAFGLVSWAASCDGGGDPTTIPIMTGAAGRSSNPTGGGYTGLAGTHAPTGAAGTASGSGNAGDDGGASGTTGAAGTLGGAAGTTGGAAGTNGGASGTTGGAAGTTGGAAGTTGGAAGTTGGAAGTTGGAAGTAGAASRAQVQAILTANCTSCHGGSGGLTLTDVSTAVGAASSGCPAKQRIVAGNPGASYLVDKLMGASQTAGGCFSGNRMPRGRAALSAANIATIVSWIRAGAN